MLTKQRGLFHSKYDPGEILQVYNFTLSEVHRQLTATKNVRPDGICREFQAITI